MKLFPILLLLMPAVAGAQVTAPTYIDTAGRVQQAEGTFCVDPDTKAKCATASGGGTPTGTAGSPNPAVVSVQGVSGGTPQPTSTADGANVTQGSLADAAYSGTGSASVVSALKGIYSATLAPLAAGSNVIGTVTARGDVASGTADSGSPVKIGGVYLSGSLPTASTGQRLNLLTDEFGSLRTKQVMSVAVATDGWPNNNIGYALADSFGTTTRLAASVVGNIYNGASWDRTRTISATDSAAGLGVAAVGVAPTSAAAQAASVTSTTAGVTALSLKASAGNVFAVQEVAGATAGFVVLYDASAAPASGATLTGTLVVYAMPIAASAGLDKVFATPVRVTNGAQLLLTTSLTTYTPPANPAAYMSGQVK